MAPSPTHHEFESFEIVVGSSTSGHYLVHITSSPAGEASALCSLEIDDELHDVLATIETTAVDEAYLAEFGSFLFASFFADDLLTLYQNSLAIVRSQGKHLRIRLQISVPELVALPWEYLYDPKEQTFLSLSADIALIRHIPTQLPVRSTEVTLPLRILVVISHPYDLPALDVLQEEAILRDGLAEWIQQGRLELEICQTATIAEISQALRRFHPHIFHYIGHGIFERDDEGEEHAYLMLQNEDGSALPIADQIFRELFSDSKEMRVVVLNACNTATLSPNKLLSGFVPHLLHRQISAVVAMQYQILDSASLIFTREFYRSLVLNYPLEQAVSEARRGIRLELGGDTAVWGVPVLFLRAKEGRLFKVQQVEELVPTILPPPEPVKPPVDPQFIGRAKELTYYRRSLRQSGVVVIAGMAGVGKTTLAAQLALQISEPNKTFWHTFRQDEGFEVIISELAGFLAWHQRSDLWQSMEKTIQSGGKLQSADVLFDYLFQQIRNQNYLLCFDDFHYVDEDPVLDRLVERLRSSVLAGEIRVIIVSRRLPEFVRVTVHEPLVGLSLADTQLLLQARGVMLGEGLLETLYTRIEGNAQLLMLAIKTLRRSKDRISLLGNLVQASDIGQFLLKEVDQSLQDEERQVMNSVAALLGYPGTRDAIEEVLAGRNAWRELAYLTNLYLLQSYQGEFNQEYGQHPILQAFYYDMLTRMQRQDMHSRAGEYYSQIEPDLLKAALHFYQANDHQRAAQLATQDIWLIINRGRARGLRELLERFTVTQLNTHLWIEINLALGQIYTLQGQGEQARKYYQVALEQLDTLPSTVETNGLVARACHGMGDSLDRESPRDALKWLQRGLSRVSDEHRQEQATLLISLGTVQMYSGAYVDAQKSLEHGLSLLLDTPSQLHVTALLNLDSVYFYQGNLEQAKIYALQALTLSEKLQDQFKMAEALGNLGLVKYVGGDWSGGVSDFQRAFNIAQQLGYRKFMAHIEMNLGAAYLNMGDDEMAQQHLMNSLEWARQNGDRSTEGLAQFRLADLNIRLEQHKTAEHLLRQAEKSAVEIDDLGLLSTICRAYAEVNLAKNDYHNAQVRINKSLDLAETLGDEEEKGIAQRILGDTLILSGDYASGIDVYLASLDTLKTQDPYELGRTQMKLGIVWYTGGNIHKGRSLLKEAKTTFIRLGAKRDLAVLKEFEETNNAI